MNRATNEAPGRATGAPVTNAERRIREGLVVPVLRGAFSTDDLAAVARALLANGVSVIEYTLTDPGAERAIAFLADEYGGEIVVGAGTVYDADDLARAEAAGATFYVSPHYAADVVEAAAERGALVLPGVFTPSEVEQARRKGLRLLKLFPAGSVGPGHIKALKGPYPDVDFVPTGGIDERNAAEYVKAGAVAVGVGSAVFKPGVPQDELDLRLRRLKETLPQR